MPDKKKSNAATAPSSRSGFSLRSFLALVRIPTVFSSMSNAFAGYCIGRMAGLGSLRGLGSDAMGDGTLGGIGFSGFRGSLDVTPALPAGLAAAALFIMAGMALNDVADKDVDARERPTRPIPSGAVTLGQAWGLSLGMMTLGLALLCLANPIAGVIGGALCLAIFLYNFVLKGTALGPASMGLCRMLNLLTGIALTWKAWPDGAALAAMPRAVYFALFSLWAYIALVTFLARDEVGGNSRARARMFLGGMALWFLGWSVAAIAWFRAQTFLAPAWVTLGLLLRNPLQNLARDPSPKHTGQMVGNLLRLVPLVDVLAMLANGVAPQTAVVGGLWILPAYIVGKLFYST